MLYSNYLKKENIQIFELLKPRKTSIYITKRIKNRSKLTL